MSAEAWFYGQSFHSSVNNFVGSGDPVSSPAMPPGTSGADYPAKTICHIPNCQSPECDRVHLMECERCGAEVPEVFPVSDCDESTGYHGNLMVCDPCRMAKGRNRCGSCA
jgi:hypothetical protein